jgi:hypothetical protein
VELTPTISSNKSESAQHRLIPGSAWGALRKGLAKTPGFPEHELGGQESPRAQQVSIFLGYRGGGAQVFQSPGPDLDLTAVRIDQMICIS